MSLSSHSRPERNPRDIDSKPQVTLPASPSSTAACGSELRTKAQLRQLYRQRRRSQTIEPLSQQICDRLSQWPLFQSAHCIYTYLALSEEINLEALVTAHPTKLWAIPRCQSNFALSWHHWHASTAIEGQRLRQPIASTPLAPPPDLILIPAIAADCWGHRLGFGGGYYDRYLATLAPQVIRVGVVPEICRSEQPLPTESWDINLQWLVTEAALYLCTAKPDQNSASQNDIAIPGQIRDNPASLSEDSASLEP